MWRALRSRPTSTSLRSTRHTLHCRCTAHSAQLSVMAIPSVSEDCRFAVLVVGLAGPSLEQHMGAASQAVLWHGGAAAVFAVGEAQEAAAFAALPDILGRPFLRALGLVSQHAVQRPSFLPQDVAFAVIRPPPPPPASVRQALQGDGGRVQWHKLREAWRLMEAGEARDGVRFELVAKLRFDCVPLFETPRLCPTRLDASRDLTIHAASDKSFWGSRAAMAIAVAVHDGLISAAPPVARAPTRSAAWWRSARCCTPPCRCRTRPGAWSRPSGNT